MIDLEAETQEPVDDTIVTQEPEVEAKVPQEEEVRVDPQELVDEVVVTQEPSAKVEKLECRDVVTPPIDVSCERIQNPKVGWCSEKLLFISELQKWKQLTLPFQKGVISLEEH